MMVSAQGPFYRRGAMAMAPHLGRQDSIISIEWYAKVWHASPLCKFSTKFEHTNGQNLTEDFFLFLVFTRFQILGLTPD